MSNNCKILGVTFFNGSLKESLIITAKKMVDFSLVFDAEIDKEKKQLKLFQKVEVEKSDDERLQ